MITKVLFATKIFSAFGFVHDPQKMKNGTVQVINEESPADSGAHILGALPCKIGVI